MDPHAVWEARGREQAARNALACVQAGEAIAAMIYVTFDNVVLIEQGVTCDVGVLRLEPQRMVFAGQAVTRAIPYGSIVLLGTRPVAGCPNRQACSVNSTNHETTMVFLGESPLEYHIGAWYSRWLDSAPFTEVDVPATVGAITPT